MLVEAFRDVQDEMRLAKTLAVGTFGSFGSFGPVPSCCKKHPEGQRSLRAASTPIGQEVSPAELRYGTALAAFVVLLASVISRPSHSREHPPLPPVVPPQLTMAPLPPPRSLPGGFCCPDGHCTVGSFGSVAGSTDSRDLFAPHDLRIQHSPQPVALALRNKRYKMNSFSK